MADPTRPRRWSARGLHGRIVLVVLIGTLGAAVAVTWTAWTGLAGVRRQLVAERELVAQSIAEQLDAALGAELEGLQGIGAGVRAATVAEGLMTERTAVREAYLRSHLLDAVLLLADPARIVWQDPPPADAARSPVLGRAATREAFATGKPAADVVSGSDGRPTVFLLVPLRDWEGRVVRVAVGMIAPGSERLAARLRPFRPGGPGRAEILDAGGAIVAASDEVPRPPARAATATASLAVAPWRLVIRDAPDEALGSLGALAGRFVGIGLAVLVLGLVFAWGAARSIERPLRVLTGAAERIASGDLTAPIPGLGDDEVGRLGRVLDRMREGLRQSHETLERRVEERTRELERVNRELSAQDRARATLLRRLISAQEEERRRVARDLHDETSQSLAALAMSLEATAAALPPGPGRTRVEDARAIAGHALGELHRLLFDLRPSVLDDLGLASAIRWCAERHLEPLGIAARCEFSGLDGRLPPEIEIAVFRAVQEAVTNIAKHAGAETVLIQATWRDGRLTVEIEDDGRGFDPTGLVTSPGGTGLGLAGMRERVTLLGGTLELESAPGEGTRIVLDVPVGREAAAHA